MSWLLPSSPHHPFRRQYSKISPQVDKRCVKVPVASASSHHQKSAKADTGSGSILVKDGVILLTSSLFRDQIQDISERIEDLINRIEPDPIRLLIFWVITLLIRDALL
jgi:hypothetical protein